MFRMSFSVCNLAFCFVPGEAASLSEHYWEQPFSQPYFDNTTRRDVTTTVGQTAHLHCRVRNLGDRAVQVSSFLILYINTTKYIRERKNLLIKCRDCPHYLDLRGVSCLHKGGCSMDKYTTDRRRNIY